MERVISLPESVIQEMIRTVDGASELLRYAGQYDNEHSVNLRLMSEMLKAGATTIGNVSSFDEVMKMLEAESITQDQFDAADAWLKCSWNGIPARTYNHVISVLTKKVKK